MLVLGENRKSAVAVAFAGKGGNHRAMGNRRNYNSLQKMKKKNSKNALIWGEREEKKKSLLFI